MLNHHFLDKQNIQLITMLSDFGRTLKNPMCHSLIDPITETRRQIRVELAKRGIVFERSNKEILKIQPKI